MPVSPAPIRVLHLLAEPACFQTERAVEALLRGSSVGTVPERADVGRGGRWRNVPTALLGLRRAVRGVDLVHCWDERALALAAFAGAPRLVFSPQPHPSAAAIRWANAVRAHRDVSVVAPSASAQRAFLRRGVPVERCRVVRPGVDFSKVNRRRDAALRSALGIGPGEFVILAPGESTVAADHRLAAWTASILHVLDPRVRLLLWGRGPMADQAAGLGAKLGQPNLVVRAEDRLGRRVPMEALLPATDAALVTATGPAAALPVAVCMAAALPIVATAEPTVAELLEDRHTCLMVPQPRARLLAERVLAVREDSSLQWRISDTARAEAYEHWSLTRFQADWREAYQAAMGVASDRREPTGSATGPNDAVTRTSARA